MITKEMLEGNEGLKGLTPEQKESIITMSRNDENAVIGARFGEVYRQMDETIANSLGIARNGDEKTYLYLQRAAGEFRDKYKDYDTLKGQIDTLKADKASLEAKIASGAGDAQLKEQYDSIKKELQATKDQYAVLQQEKNNLVAEHQKALAGMRIDAELAKAREGLKFKPGLNAAAIENLIGVAMNKIKGYSPKFEGEQGKEALHFYDNGVIMNNPANNLNPFTAKELLVRELQGFDILDNALRTGAGGGNTPPQYQGGSGYATQKEAVDAIEKELSAKGLVRGTAEYGNEMFRLYEENKVDSLPLQ